MRFNITINQQRCLQVGLNASQAALMALFGELSAWATEKHIGGKLYWHISRNKVIEEIPLFYEKPDTVYRHFRLLAEKGMIEYVNQNRTDYVRLTPQGKRWNNSDLNPSKLGNESELGNESGQLGNESEFNKFANPSQNQSFNPVYSDSVPTYNINNNTNHKSEENAHDFLMRICLSDYETFCMQFKTALGQNWDPFVADFNVKVIKEELSWKPAVLFARMRQLAQNWIRTEQNRKSNGVNVVPAGKVNNEPRPKTNYFG